DTARTPRAAAAAAAGRGVRAVHVLREGPRHAVVRRRAPGPEHSGRAPHRRARLHRLAREGGVLYVQPPVKILEQLVAVRLQLDPDAAAAGPLEVVPGSHRERRTAAD